MGDIGYYLYLSVFGLAVVMFALVLIMAYITLQSKVFVIFGGLFGKRSKTAPVPAPAAEHTEAPKAEEKKPATPWDGKLVLRDVTDQEAVLIMAIVSRESGIPLDELQFRSIKLISK